MTALVRRDLLLALQSGTGVWLATAFFVLIVVLVPFGVGADPVTLARIAPGMLWVAALLSVLLSLERIVAPDLEDGTIEALAASPLPLEGVALGKALVHWITTGLPLAVVSPLCAVMLQIPSEAIVALVLSLLIGTPALSAIGTFGAALTVGMRHAGLIVALIVLPLAVPVLILGASVAMGQGSGIAVLAALSLAASASLPFATAAALRAAVRGG